MGIDNATEENVLEIRKTEFKDFISILGLEASEIGFRLIAEHPLLKASGVSGGGLTPIVVTAGKYKDADSLFNILNKYNKQGYACYWQPQAFDFANNKGNKKENYDNLSQVRFIVCDADKGGIEAAKKAKAVGGLRCVVESSSGRTQLIWKIKGDDHSASRNGVAIDHTRINEVMKGLAAVYGGDKAACKAVQVFRVPGFYWCKKGSENKYLSRVIFADIEACVSLNDLSSLSATLATASDTAEYKAVSSSLASASPVKANFVPKGERHDTLVSEAISCLMRGYTEAEMRSECEKRVRECYECGDEYLRVDSTEVENAFKYAVEKAQENRERDKALLKEQDERFEAGKTAAIEVVIPAGAPVFDYVYSPRTMACKEQPYSDDAIMHRVIELFVEQGDFGLARRKDKHPWLMRVLGSGEIKAWSEVDKVWTNCGNGKDATSEKSSVLNNMLREVIERVVNEEAFRRMYGKDAKGQPCPTKFSETIRKFKSYGFQKSALSYIYANKDSVLPIIDVMAFNSVEGILPVAGSKVVDIREALRLKGLKISKEGNIISWGNGEEGCGVKVRDVQASDLLTVSSNIKWKGIDYEEKECIGWKKFLDDVFSRATNRLATIDMLQRVFGLALSNHNDRQIYIHSGGGCNGKSLTLEALKTISGGYAYSLAGDIITTKKRSISETPFNRTLASLVNKRVGIIDDLEAGDVWNQGLLKNITAPTLNVRWLYGEEAVVRNLCKLHIALNTLPKVDKENNGLTDRLVIIPYDNRFKNNPVAGDKLRQMIQDEAGGILSWAIRGWIKRNISTSLGQDVVTLTDDVKEACLDYRNEAFQFETMVKDCFTVNESEEFSKYEATFNNEGLSVQLKTAYPDYIGYKESELIEILRDRGHSIDQLMSAGMNGRLIKAVKNIFTNALWRREGRRKERVIYLKKINVENIE